MRFPISELCDRLSILKLKIERLSEDNTLIELFALFYTEFEQRISMYDKSKQSAIYALFEELYGHNANIWNLECDLRAGKMNEKNDLEEIGRRAISIRDHNKKRLTVKNRIALLVSEKFGLDKKIDHGSE